MIFALKELTVVLKIRYSKKFKITLHVKMTKRKMESAMKDQRRKKFYSAENLKEWAEFAQLVIEERHFSKSEKYEKRLGMGKHWECLQSCEQPSG